MNNVVTLSPSHGRNLTNDILNDNNYVNGEMDHTEEAHLRTE